MTNTNQYFTQNSHESVIGVWICNPCECEFGFQIPMKVGWRIGLPTAVNKLKFPFPFPGRVLLRLEYRKYWSIGTI